MTKYRKIPKIDKKDLCQWDIGYHDIPNWLLIIFVSVVFLGMFAIILF